MNRRLGVLMLSTFTMVGLAVPSTASADVTVFLGLSPTPQSRVLKGASFGMGLILVGFELEYADVSAKENATSPSPRLRTGMANAIVQTPTSGAQLYGTAGVGAYREELGSRRETHTAINIGGGIKLNLLGPLRLRVDYRLFTLRGAPLHKTVHRVYAGVNTSF